MKNHRRKLWLAVVAGVVSLAVFPAGAQQYGWVKVAQLGDQFTQLQAVDFVDSLHGWAVFDSVYCTTDGGNTWTSHYSAFRVGLSSISMVDTFNGWTAGYPFSSSGGIYRTTNGGVSWTQQRYVANRAYVGVSARTAQKAITVGYSTNLSALDTGRVLQTTDGGTTWTERTIADSIPYLGRIQFVDSVHGWVSAEVGSFSGGRTPYLLRTCDGGLTWSVNRTPESFLYSFSFLDSLRGWGSSYQFRVFRTTDGGVTWEHLYDNYNSDELSPSAIAFVDSLNGWAFGGTFYMGGSASSIKRTTDGGHTWTRESVALSTYLNAAIMLDLHHGWAVGDDGAVLRYQLLTSVPERLPSVPQRTSLRQNYPNPFNPTTTIEYELTERTQVRLTIYDALGKAVKKLVNSVQEPGVFRLHFDGSTLASGVYYCSLSAGQYRQTRQMNLIK